MTVLRTVGSLRCRIIRFAHCTVSALRTARRGHLPLPRGAPLYALLIRGNLLLERKRLFFQLLYSLSIYIPYLFANGYLGEPIAMLRKLANSLLPLLPAPSAMLDGIETAARVICETNPYFSLAGNILVTSYILRASLMPSCQICKFL